MIPYASCYGWLILQSLDSKHCHIFNPVTFNKIQLPPLPPDTFHPAVLSSPPTDPKCVIMFFSMDENMFVFCRIGDENWIKQTWNYERFHSVGSSNGMIYVFFHEGFARIDLQGNLACIEPYEVQDPLCWSTDSPPNSSCRSYILESCGEIFQVCEIVLGSSDIVQNFFVYKLDVSKMAWEHVQCLGDRIILLCLGSSSGSVLTEAEFGSQGNCIYFFAEGRTDLYRFDMEDGTIMVTQPCPTKFTEHSEPFWVVPNCNLQGKKEKAVVEDMQGCDSILPPELLQIIFNSLNLGGIIRFRVACKAFISMTPPVQCLSLKHLSDSQLPWLISLPITTKKICHFYHPIYTDVCTMNLPQLKGASVQSAKFGWLLMCMDRYSLFFFNPITTETLKLPMQPSCLKIMSFSSPPTSSDCVVFGFELCAEDIVYMSYYHRGKNSWTPHHLRDLPYTFIPSSCNPVFHNGVFYCLSKDGKLGIFDPNGTSEEDMWRVYTSLSVQDVCCTSLYSLLIDSTRSFIMENNGDIYSVFVGFVGSPVRVYKLDQSKKKMRWLVVRTLDDKVMFLSHTTCLLIPAVLKGTENRIYFPRLKKMQVCSILYSHENTIVSEKKNLE